MPQIEVTFSIDANGILNASAKDTATGKEQSIEIKGSSGLDEAEIKKMRADAESHAEEDKKRRELVDLKNRGDQLAYTAEKTLKDMGDKVSAEDRGSIESAISSLREALKGDDADAIKRTTEALEQASHKIAEQMYKQTAETQAAAGGQVPPEGEAKPGGKDDKGDDVIDAEYEVKE